MNYFPNFSIIFFSVINNKKMYVIDFYLNNVMTDFFYNERIVQIMFILLNNCNKNF